MRRFTMLTIGVLALSSMMAADPDAVGRRFLRVLLRLRGQNKFSSMLVKTRRLRLSQPRNGAVISNGDNAPGRQDRSFFPSRERIGLRKIDIRTRALVIYPPGSGRLPRISLPTVRGSTMSEGTDATAESSVLSLPKGGGAVGGMGGEVRRRPVQRYRQRKIGRP